MLTSALPSNSPAESALIHLVAMHAPCLHIVAMHAPCLAQPLLRQPGQPASDVACLVSSPSSPRALALLPPHREQTRRRLARKGGVPTGLAASSVLRQRLGMPGGSRLALPQPAPSVRHV